jgi:hypothetical protein
MNGRVYDPVMGQFLSPDPFINAGITTGYNRYSYCHGNPLNRIDPSGYIDIMGAGDIDKTGSGCNWSIFNYFNNGYHRGDNNYGPGNESIFPVYGLSTSPKDQFEYDFQLGQNIAATGGTTGYLFGVLSAAYHGQYGEYFSGPNAVADANAYLESFKTKLIEIKSSSYLGLDPGYYIRIKVRGSTNLSGNGRITYFPPSGGGGGHSFSDYLSFGFNAGDLYYSGTGSALHNELYWVQKNGTPRLTSNTGNNYLLQRSYRITGELAESAKIAARSFAYASTAISGINMITDFRFANTFDFAMGLTTFLPGVGWAISGLYFISNVAVESYTGKTIGEHLEMQINKIGQ